MVAQLCERGITVELDSEGLPNGRFARLSDPEGNPTNSGNPAARIQAESRTAYLRLAETLSVFVARLRLAADTLDILERQRIVRLVVKEVLVGDDTIVIRHSIPVPPGPPGGSSPPPLGGSDDLGADRSYLLRTGRAVTFAFEHRAPRARR